MLLECASMHSLVSSYEQMLSGVFIVPDGVFQTAALHGEGRDIVAITYSRKHLHYIYLLTSIWQILQYDRFFLVSNCPLVILFAALLLNSRCCTAKPLQIPSLIFRNVLGYARDPSQRVTTFPLTRDHHYCGHSSAISTPDSHPVPQKSLNPAGERMWAVNL